MSHIQYQVETYRSEPLVNMDPDMIRVVMCMPRWLWRILRPIIDREEQALNVEVPGGH